MIWLRKILKVSWVKITALKVLVVVGNGIPGHIQLSTDFILDTDDIDEYDSENETCNEVSLQNNYGASCDR